MAAKKDDKAKGKKLQVKKLKVTDLPSRKAADAKGGVSGSKSNVSINTGG